MLEIEITLDRPRTLRYDWPAFAAMDRAFRQSCGRSTVQMIRDYGEGLGEDFDALQTLLWGGLRWEDKRLTPDAVGAMLQAQIENSADQGQIWGKTFEALMGSGLLRPRSKPNGEDPDSLRAETSTTRVGSKMSSPE